MSMTKFALVTQQLSDCQAGNKSGGSGHTSLNKNYCWSYSYLSDHLYWYYTATKPDNQRRAKASEIMGGFQATKTSWGTAGTNNNFNVHSWNYITELVPIIPEAAVDDSGCNSHLIKLSTPCGVKYPTIIVLCVGIPKGAIMQALHEEFESSVRFYIALDNYMLQGEFP